MNFYGKWRRRAFPAVAMAFDGERMWSVDSRGGEVSVTAACLALDAKSRKVVSVGDEAARLRGQDPERVLVLDYIREGMIGSFDLAEAAVRYHLRKTTGGFWRFPPRVLVATRSDEMAKRAMKDVMLHAGARDVITIPILMAAALGAELDVNSPQPVGLFHLDRDWAGFAVIQSNAILVSSELAGGVEQMLEDVAAQARRASPAAPGPGTLHTKFKATGLEPGADHGGHALFVLRWRERFLQAIETLPVRTRNELQRGALYLVGPYARVPGMLDLFTSSLEWKTVSPKEPERVVILGCRKVLGDLDRLMKSVK